MNQGPSSLRILWAIQVVALLSSGCDQTRFHVRVPPGQQVDVFRQAVVPTIDILWVVDNSPSMTPEQQALADNFSSFFKYLDTTQVDFQIGVISTDVYNSDQRGKLLGAIPIISRATPQTAAVFAQNIHVGTEGKGDEQGLKAADLALSEPLISTNNSGFLRTDAYLFIIFVTDEDDHSFGEVAYFHRLFEQIKGIGNDGMIAVGAVVGDVPDGCGTALPGLRYAELAQESGGLVTSICSQDFSDNLDRLGFAAAGLKRHFSLSRTAFPDSIHVYVKTDCAGTPVPKEACDTVYNDCGGSTSGIYGYTCVVKASVVTELDGGDGGDGAQGQTMFSDGYVFDLPSNSIQFYGQAVPTFGSIIEVGYIPNEETP